MERLPTVRESSVQQSSTVTPYYSVRANPDAFGAGIGRALQQLGGTIGQLGEIEVQIANQARAAEGFKIEAGVRDQIRELAYNPQSGWFAQRGGDAFDLTAHADKAMQDIFTATLEGVEDPKTRQALEKSFYGSLRGQVLDSTARHSFGELQTYSAEGFKAQAQSAVADAFNSYNDPAAVDDAINRAKGAIRGTADLAGLNPEQVAQIERETASSIHMAVLQRYAQEDPEGALSYYNQHRESITGKDHVAAGQLIRPAIIEQRSRDHVGRITGLSSAVTAIMPSVVQIESSGNQNAVSPAGAMGLAQLMFPAAREAAQERGYHDVVRMSDAELRQVLLDDPKLNVELGAHYLDKQLKRFDGDMELALIAYNAGPSRAEAFVASGRDRSKLPAETRNYVNKVLNKYQNTQTEAPPGVYSTPSGQRMTRENSAGKLQNFSFEQLAGSGGWIDEQAAMGLDRAASAFRAATGKDMVITSGTRSPERNLEVGGAKNSVHMAGAAFDISIRGMSDAEQASLVTELRKQGFNGFGIYQGHLHADMRANPQRWATGRSMPKWLSDMLDQDAPQGPGPSPAPGASRTEQGQAPNIPTAPVTVPTIGFDYGAAVQAANEITDPNVRARTLQLLSQEKAQQDSIQAAAKQGAKQALWDHVLQGGDAAGFSQQNLDASRLLEPSDFNSVFSFEKNRAEGGPVTDKEVYTNLRFMSRQELANIQPLDHRNDLNDTDYKDLVNRVVDAREALQGDPEALARNSSAAYATSTFDNVMRAAGIRVDGSRGDEQNLAKLRLAFLDAHTQALESNGGKPLHPADVRQLADQVLVSSWVPGRVFSGSVVDEVPELPSWDSVPREAATHLTRTYERLFQKTPTDEEALGVYQSALEIWNGRQPTEEDPYWREYTTRHRERYGPVPLETLRIDYGIWIRDFLPVR